jgi:hypothetical protein
MTWKTAPSFMISVELMVIARSALRKLGRRATRIAAVLPRNAQTLQMVTKVVASL